MYQIETEGWLKHYDFILLDLICLHIVFVLAFAASGQGWNPYQNALYRNMSIFLTLSDLLVIFSMDTLKGVLKRDKHAEFLFTSRHMAVLMAVALLYLFLLQQGGAYSRRALILTFVFYAVLTWTVRFLWKRVLVKHRATGGDRSLLIITSSDIAEEVIGNLKKNNYAGYTISGAVLIDDADTIYNNEETPAHSEAAAAAAENESERKSHGTHVAGIPVVASSEKAAMYVCKEWIDEVLVIPSEDCPFPQKLMDELQETGVTIHLNLAKISNEPGKKQIVERVGGYTVLTTSINYASARQLLIKRAMDIAVGIVGCICTGILFLFIAPAIYIQSPGPIFFSQERVGKNGKKFKLYKFRSMYLDAEERKAELMKENKMSDGRMFKMDFDPRVIGNRVLPDGSQKKGFGQFLRDSSLDEFPQFFNVLKGEMSVVGTRPPIPGETSEYELHHRARLSIKPGITGMWQVSGRSDITDFEEVVRLDRQYISEWNIWLDIKILFKTVGVVLFRKGA
ncbi:MAG: sugar transferase, partial [Lachnospiraceae bacterium]|nr:sugar transferase [Lachnospiraceae bacterium]